MSTKRRSAAAFIPSLKDSGTHESSLCTTNFVTCARSAGGSCLICSIISCALMNWTIHKKPHSASCESAACVAVPPHYLLLLGGCEILRRNGDCFITHREQGGRFSATGHRSGRSQARGTDFRLDGRSGRSFALQPK